MNSSEKPVTAVLGGAKVSSKITAKVSMEVNEEGNVVVHVKSTSLKEQLDNVIAAMAMSNTLLNFISW